MQCVMLTHCWSTRGAFSSSTIKSGPRGISPSVSQRPNYHTATKGPSSYSNRRYSWLRSRRRRRRHGSTHSSIWVPHTNESGLCYVDITPPIHSPQPIPRRRLMDARDTYQKVIEIDPRNVPSLVLLGSAYQLLDDPDRAIVKYHEVFVITELPLTVDCANQYF